MLHFFRKLFIWIKSPYTKRKEQRELEKRLEELKKRDPFIYK
jgi:hypothetical protein